MIMMARRSWTGVLKQSCVPVRPLSSAPTLALGSSVSRGDVDFQETLQQAGNIPLIVDFYAELSLWLFEVFYVC